MNKKTFVEEFLKTPYANGILGIEANLNNLCIDGSNYSSENKKHPVDWTIHLMNNDKDTYSGSIDYYNKEDKDSKKIEYEAIKLQDVLKDINIIKCADISVDNVNIPAIYNHFTNLLEKSGYNNIEYFDIDRNNYRADGTCYAKNNPDSLDFSFSVIINNKDSFSAFFELKNDDGSKYHVENCQDKSLDFIKKNILSSPTKKLSEKSISVSKEFLPDKSILLDLSSCYKKDDRQEVFRAYVFHDEGDVSKTPGYFIGISKIDSDNKYSSLLKRLLIYDFNKPNFDKDFLTKLANNSSVWKLAKDYLKERLTKERLESKQNVLKNPNNSVPENDSNKKTADKPKSKRR